MAEMTSRERVLAAINHQEPDRVPLDIGAGGSTTIVIEGYENLKRYLGEPVEQKNTKFLNKVFRMARIDESIMKRLGSDCRPIGIKPPVNWTPPSPPGPDMFIDIWGITWRKVSYDNNCFYNEVVDCPLAEATKEDLEDYPWPDPEDPGFTSGLAEEAKNLYENTDFSLVGDGGFKSFWELGYMMRGYERLLIDLVDNKEFVKTLFEKFLEINIKGTGRFLDAVGPYIQVFRTADDMASQNGPLMSPATYREIIKPVYKKYYDFIKSKTEAKIFYHSCGNVVDLLDDFIENGVDILNPVQVSAIGNTFELKKRFGDKLVFWGGIDTQHVLPHGSVQEVEEEVQKRIRDLAPGGGYVVASVHAIQPDVPPENIIAMDDATRKYGNYPVVV